MKKIESLSVTKYFDPQVSYYHSGNMCFDGNHFYYQDTEVAYLFHARFPVLFLPLEIPDNVTEIRFIIQELKERSPYPVITVPFLLNDNFFGREGEISMKLFCRFVQILRTIQLEQRADFSKIREKDFRRIQKCFHEFLEVTKLKKIIIEEK